VTASAARAAAFAAHDARKDVGRGPEGDGAHQAVVDGEVEDDPGRAQVVPGGSGPVPGAAAIDAPVSGPRGDWLLGYLGGGFTLLCFGGGVPADAVRLLAGDGIACTVVQVGGKPAAGVCSIDDSEGLAAKRYDARQGACYLLRPDQHVCARWRAFELGAVRAALARATAQVATAAKAAA